MRRGSFASPVCKPTRNVPVKSRDGTGRHNLASWSPVTLLVAFIKQAQKRNNGVKCGRRVDGVSVCKVLELWTPQLLL